MSEKMYSKLASEALTGCSVSADGESVTLGFKDRKGREKSLELPISQAGSLAMTLPALIEHALRRKYGDSSLRYVYPLDRWALEQSSDPQTRMITLRTADGFSVCFSMPLAMLGDLGHALTEVPEVTLSSTVN